MARPKKYETEEEKLEAKKIYNREYQKAHRAQNNAARKKWRKNHPEAARELDARTVANWQKKNREKYNAYQREWRAKQKAKENNNDQLS